MKKTIAISAALVLLISSASWGISFQNLNPTGVTPVTIAFEGAAMGGPGGGALLSRFVPGAGVQTVASWNGGNDFFGIFRLQTITNTTTNNAVFDGASAAAQNKDIVGIFYGVNEEFYTFPTAGAPITIYSIGGRMEFYEVTYNTWNAIIANGPTSGNLDDSGLSSGGTFAGITDVGTQLFALDFAPGALPNAGVTIPASANPSTITDVREILTGTDQGDFFGHIDPTWGTIPTVFNNGGFAVDANSIATDFKGLYSMEPLTPGTFKANNGWQLNFGGGPNHSSNMQQVPEPSTLLLLGTGLLGMVGYARRRKAA